MRDRTEIPAWLDRRRFSPLVKQIIAERIAARPLSEQGPPAPAPVRDNVIRIDLVWLEGGRLSIAPHPVRRACAGGG